MSTDHVSHIFPHLLITLDRLNTSGSEYLSRPCLDHQNIDFSENWDKNRRGLLQIKCNRYFSRSPFPIGRAPRGFVHIPTVGREIYFQSRPCACVPITGGSIKTGHCFWVVFLRKYRFFDVNSWIWFIIDIWMKIHQFSINSLHVCSR